MVGICNDRILVPTFIDGDFTGQINLEILQDYFVPELAVMYPNSEHTNIPNAIIWDEQDGAPSHYAIIFYL